MTMKSRILLICCEEKLLDQVGISVICCEEKLLDQVGISVMGWKTSPHSTWGSTCIFSGVDFTDF